MIMLEVKVHVACCSHRMFFRVIHLTQNGHSTIKSRNIQNFKAIFKINGTQRSWGSVQKYLLSRLVAIIPKNRVGTLGQSLYGEAHILDENLESLIKFE